MKYFNFQVVVWFKESNCLTTLQLFETFVFYLIWTTYYKTNQTKYKD